jgi:hypothetical protein
MVEESVIRGVALQVFLVALFAAFTSNPAAVIFLVIDFFIRLVKKPRFSLTVLLSRNIILRIIRFRRRRILARPKRFAAAIGFTISLAAAVLLFTGLPTGALFLMGILALFSFLEAFFAFCAGCYLFRLLIRLGLAEDDLCTDCVYPGGDGI